MSSIAPRRSAFMPLLLFGLLYTYPRLGRTLGILLAAAIRLAPWWGRFLPTKD